MLKERWKGLLKDCPPLQIDINIERGRRLIVLISFKRGMVLLRRGSETNTLVLTELTDNVNLPLWRDTNAGISSVALETLSETRFFCCQLKLSLTKSTFFFHRNEVKLLSLNILFNAGPPMYLGFMIHLFLHFVIIRTKISQQPPGVREPTFSNYGAIL